MRPLLYFCLSVSLVFLVACGKDDQAADKPQPDNLDAIFMDVYKHYDHLAVILEGINDKSDWDKMKADVRSIVDKFDDVDGRIEKVLKDKDTEELEKEMKSVEHKFEKKKRLAEKRLNEAVTALPEPIRKQFMTMVILKQAKEANRKYRQALQSLLK